MKRHDAMQLAATGKVDELLSAAENGFVVLQALSLSIKWELATDVKSEVDSAAIQLGTVLSQIKKYTNHGAAAQS